jgi:hypothetical protein
MDDGTDGRMDGWMGHVMKKLHEKRPRCPLLYVMKCSNIPFFERQRVNVNKSKRKIVVNVLYYLFDANFKSLLHLARQTN